MSIKKSKKRFLKIVSVTAATIISIGCISSASAADIKVNKNSASSDAGVVALPFKGEETVLSVKSTEIPSSYSSKDMGYVTPVRNQSNTEDCWAFSGTSGLETLLAKNGEITPTADNWLSVSHMDAWGSVRSDGTGWQRTYEFGGGYPYITLGYLSSWTGAIKESIYPFRSPISMFDVNQMFDIDYGVTGIMYIDGSDKDTVKKSIMDYGSVTSSFNYYSRFSNNYGTNYYCPKKQSSVYGHSISIVGWDDNYSKDNFKVEVWEDPVEGTTNPDNPEEEPQQVLNTYIPQNDGAWLCKNSWGESTGNQGYFWISYEDSYLFSSNFGPSYCLTDYVKKDKYTNIYQVEKYGATYEFSYLKNYSKPVFINVFDFNGNNDAIDKIVFESESIGAKYKIYSIPMDNEGKAPSEDTSLWVEIGNGTIPYSGYICNDIDNYIPSDGKSGIGIEIDSSSSSASAGVGVSEWLTSNNKPLFNTDAKHGVSYIYYGGIMDDVMDFYKDMFEDDLGGNLVIKAITTNKNVLIGDVTMDGKVDVADATAIQKYSVHQIELNPAQLTNADYNGDDCVNIKDVTAIQKHLAAIE